ncbi:MAG TPA: type VI secretion system baseplate subunit TssG, partial [Sphingobium sp.]|nr:type VI secretion system baseplate subunit TssG [Sphingobium sp.]
DARASLGRGTVLGAAVRDAQHAFRLVLGPMRLADYMQFLPGRKKWRQLRDWVREYVGIEFAWDARLLLDRRDVRGIALGRPAPLGLASWLGTRPEAMGDAGDLVVAPERCAGTAPGVFNTKRAAA